MRKSKVSKSKPVEQSIVDTTSYKSMINALKNVDKSIEENAIPNRLILPHALINRSAEPFYISDNLPDLLCEEIELDSKFTFTDLLHVQDRVTFAHAVSSVIQNGDDRAIEVRLNTASKTNAPKQLTWIEIVVSKLNGNNEVEQAALATFRDISVRKKGEEDLLNAKILAEEVSVAKSQFLANTSHELRTPLNAILGFSDLLTSPIVGEVGEEKRAEYTSLINDSARHLLSVLNGILDMSKIESGKYEIVPESFELSKCLENTIAIMGGMAQITDIKIESDGITTLPQIIADEKAVRQIMLNLISNAIKFSQIGSNIKVRAERKARSVSIFVEDKGIGISKEHLEHLGKPFFQVDSKYDRKYEGTGLGLSVVRGLVELHDGSINFSSDKDKGTSVCVTLPIHGTTGRQIPGREKTEKVTSIFSTTPKSDFKIARSGM